MASAASKKGEDEDVVTLEFGFGIEDLFAQQRMPGRIFNFIDIFLGNVQNEALFIGIREKGAFGRYREPVLRIEAAAVHFV